LVGDDSLDYFSPDANGMDVSACGSDRTVHWKRGRHTNDSAVEAAA
jgi:hypothetical protein